MNINIIIYENELKNSGNLKFFYEIKHELRPNIVRSFARVDLFEKELEYNIVFDVFLLDIMGNEVDFKGADGKILRTMIGIELLKRIRAGHYPTQKKDSLIIMRTARATEPGIGSLCFKEGANYCFNPGADDQKIIGLLKEKFRKLRPSKEGMSRSQTVDNG